MAKIKYYDRTNIMKTGAQYLMLLGPRSPGKSYQAKEEALTKAYKGIATFVYLRRWDKDIKYASVESYFEDMPIKKYTKGEYDGVKAWNGYIYFTSTADDGSKVTGKRIGRYCSLNKAEHYKSQTFKERIIIYEEFITDEVYLANEPTKLQQFVSTVFRHDKGTVFLIGNTLSRTCPYFFEWCLEGVLKQKVGTIEVYHYDTDEGRVDIAVEYCSRAENTTNSMFFGQAAKQIVTGEWDVLDVPKLPKPREEYEKIYEVMVIYMNFKFVIELLVEPKEGGVICYVYPHTKKREVVRKITNTFSDSLWISAKLDLAKKPEKMIYDCFRLGKVCYSDNLTGSDFKNVNKQFRIGELI